MRNDSLPAAKETVAVEHDNSAAAVAADFNVRSGANDGPFTGTAWMGFAGSDYITDENLFNHTIPRSGISVYRINIP